MTAGNRNHVHAYVPTAEEHENYCVNDGIPKAPLRLLVGQCWHLDEGRHATVPLENFHIDNIGVDVDAHACRGVEMVQEGQRM